MGKGVRLRLKAGKGERLKVEDRGGSKRNVEEETMTIERKGRKKKTSKDQTDYEGRVWRD